MPARHHRTLLPYTATLCAAVGSGLAYAYWITARTRPAVTGRSRRRTVGRHRAPSRPFDGFSRYLTRRHGWTVRLLGPAHRLSVG